jgi:hypothetical protein
VENYGILLIGIALNFVQARIDVITPLSSWNHFCIMIEMANCAALHKVMSDFAVDSHPVHELDSIYRPRPILRSLLCLLEHGTTVVSIYSSESKSDSFVCDQLCVKHSNHPEALYVLQVTECMFLMKQIRNHISVHINSAKPMDDPKLFPILR